jgi:RNA polymerase sigma-70 factor (ECF subfamily)
MLGNAVTDAELVDRLKARDADAYREVVALYGGGLYRYLYGMTGNHHLSEDIVGDVYLRMLENIDKYTYTGAPFKSWLYRIAHNLAINALMRTPRTAPVESLELMEDPFADPAIPVARQLDAMELQEALTVLTDEQRHVIVLRFISSQNIHEVAVTLGKT